MSEPPKFCIFTQSGLKVYDTQIDDLRLGVLTESTGLNPKCPFITYQIFRISRNNGFIYYPLARTITIPYSTPELNTQVVTDDTFMFLHTADDLRKFETFLLL